MSRINIISSNAVAFNNAITMQTLTNQIKRLFEFNINVIAFFLVILLLILCMRSFNLCKYIKIVSGIKNQLKIYIKKLVNLFILGSF